jgi:hypothetical protein
MLNMYKKLIILLALIFSNISYAHQPVMDMAPRWENGYGFQLRNETYISDTLLQQDSEQATFVPVKSRTTKFWLEGVYTYKRWLRFTFKLPVIKQLKIVGENKSPVKKSSYEVGDLIVAVPLKLYKNLESTTQNIAFTPSLRIPTGDTKSELPTTNGSFDVGLSFSKSIESEKFYQLYDIFYWLNTQGEKGHSEGNELGLDINWGYHPYHDNSTNQGIFVMLDLLARYKAKGTFVNSLNGGLGVHTGPILVVYSDNIMFRGSFNFPLYERLEGLQFSRGLVFNLGIGFVF